MGVYIFQNIDCKMLGYIKKNILIPCVGFYLNGSLDFWSVVLYIFRHIFVFLPNCTTLLQASAFLLFLFNNAVLIQSLSATTRYSRYFISMFSV